MARLVLQFVRFISVRHPMQEKEKKHDRHLASRECNNPWQQNTTAADDNISGTIKATCIPYPSRVLPLERDENVARNVVLLTYAQPGTAYGGASDSQWLKKIVDHLLHCMLSIA